MTCLELDFDQFQAKDQCGPAGNGSASSAISVGQFRGDVELPLNCNWKQKQSQKEDSKYNMEVLAFAIPIFTDCVVPSRRNMLLQQKKKNNNNNNIPWHPRP